jgi:hypothetical protein
MPQTSNPIRPRTSVGALRSPAADRRGNAAAPHGLATTTRHSIIDKAATRVRRPISHHLSII